MEFGSILEGTKAWLWSWLTDRGTWLTIFSIFVGSAISWIVSKHYYEASGRDLEAETVRLRELHNYTLTILQNMQAGPHVKSTVVRDENGTPKGISVSVGSEPMVGHGSAHGGEAAGTDGSQH